MNPEQLIAEAAKAMADRVWCISKKYRICHHKGKTQCIDVLAPCVVEIVFAVFTEEQIIKGLSSAQWDFLKERMVNFYQQKGWLT